MVKGTNVALNGELSEEVECFRYSRSKMTVDAGRETDVKSRINDVGKVLGGLEKMFSYSRTMGINVKRRLYAGVVVPTPLYGDETWSMGVAEKRLNVMEMMCQITMFGVTCLDRVWIDKVRRRVGWSSRAVCVEVVWTWRE